MAPDYALGAHTASLGLTFNTGKLCPQEMEGGAFIGQHGSWNRKPRAGYKVIFVPFKDGKPSGAPQDVLTGFLNETGEAQGRPVGVQLDKQGALLVADDVGNTIWRVTPAAKSASRWATFSCPGRSAARSDALQSRGPFLPHEPVGYRLSGATLPDDATHRLGCTRPGHKSHTRKCLLSFNPCAW